MWYDNNVDFGDAIGTENYCGMGIVMRMEMKLCRRGSIGEKLMGTGRGVEKMLWIEWSWGQFNILCHLSSV